MRGMAFFLSLAMVMACSAADDLVGRKIADFRLQDFRGGWHSLQEIDANHIVVVAFVGTECPLAKLYGPRLAENGHSLCLERGDIPGD